MTDAEAMLEAIDAAPSDPLPRLVLADWFDDRGWGVTAASLRRGGWMVWKKGDGDGYDSFYRLSRGYAMTDGLHLICSPAGWSPYVMVAWCRVRDGWIEYAPGCRVIRRFGGQAQLAKLAAKGPIATTQLLDPSELAEGCSMAMVSRFLVCDPKAWKKECPMPAGWLKLANS